MVEFRVRQSHVMTISPCAPLKAKVEADLESSANKVSSGSGWAVTCGHILPHRQQQADTLKAGLWYFISINPDVFVTFLAAAKCHRSDPTNMNDHLSRPRSRWWAALLPHQQSGWICFFTCWCMCTCVCNVAFKTNRAAPCSHGSAVASW